MALAGIRTAQGVHVARVDIHRGQAALATPLDLESAGVASLPRDQVAWLLRD
jgi:hypothetical protein